MTSGGHCKRSRVGHELGIMQGLEKNRLAAPVAEAEGAVGVLDDLPGLDIGELLPAGAPPLLDALAGERRFQDPQLLLGEHHSISTSSRIQTGKSASESSAIGASEIHWPAPYFSMHAR